MREPGTVEAVPRSVLAVSWRRFSGDRLALGAAAGVSLFIVLAVAAPWVAPHDPNDGDLLRRLQPPAWLAGGEWSYALGCDALGRDLLSRIVFGARISLAVGVAVVLLAAVVGTLAGLAAGFLGRAVDGAVSRVVDVLLAFPYLIFAIGLMGMMGPGLENIVLALVYKEWAITARVARGETLAVREREYVQAARAAGASAGRIMLRAILPNVLTPVLVVATTRMATIIVLEASLAFLGLGVQPPTASWGSMVVDGRGFLVDAWWVSAFPGLAIFLLVLALNLAAQGLADAFDPRRAA